ncbi:esterase [Pseudoclavibacter chungangensis]|uniref:Esterase n=1 Tax=Pseudoclavibacter chungangensis TaxID=587635 RepID=A0A7J5C0Q9_9MICO|nr:dienelactone hydrolase family protein [Pseudoclavibacter chungangensis]KAB1662199.1 esterase [Pseudoclavibacter chungangensis]NYJ65396.1 phospholipase/carboxylesterase [Pseudoclavibacter chungangensis]
MPDTPATALQRSSEPLSAVDGRPLVVVLHGFGSDDADVHAITDRLGTRPVFLSLRAPLAAPEPIPGAAWFPLRFASDGTVLGAGAGAEHDAARADVDEGATQAATDVLARIDGILAAEGVTPSSLAFVGFSQGGIVAMQALRLAPERVATTVLFSGLVVPAPLPGDAVLAERRPRILWGRGALDPVIPAAAVEFTEQWLEAHTTPEVIVEPAIGHELTNAELAAAAELLDAVCV